VPLTKIAEEVGTPFYVYSRATLERHFRVFDDAFKGVDHMVCFAVKANSNLSVLRLFAGLGGGADVVSGGELFRVLKAGVPPGKIVYAGVGKTVAEIEFALNSGILMFNIESTEELEAVDEAAGRLGVKARAALRINPDVDARTHPYISTGLKKNKFGIPIENAENEYRQAAALGNIDVVGIHQHIGSQLTEVEPFVDALEKTVGLVRKLNADGFNIRYINIGGGLGIKYLDEEPPAPSELAEALRPVFEGSGCTLIFEPGRVLVGNAGSLVTKVLYRKSTEVKNFVVVDAGMNDLIRPTLYDAYHDVRHVTPHDGESYTADIVGPICETGDFLARERVMVIPERGDLLAVMSAGAYGFTMSSNYNSRPRTPEILVDGDEYRTIRKREEMDDLVRLEEV
jgi:diaminopimelate decarboxylase